MKFNKIIQENTSRNNNYIHSRKIYERLDPKAENRRIREAERRRERNNYSYDCCKGIGDCCLLICLVMSSVE